MRTRPITRLLLLAILCGLALTPFVRWGSPSGHDFEFHLYSWMEILQQWKEGTIYPRWAELAHWGYGEARFLFYPPGSWTLGAALGAVLPWKIVPGVYCWIVLTAAAASMYALARVWLRPPDALFAAAFYALSPYHLLIVYWRSAYAELLAAIAVPLVLLCLLRLKEGGLRPILWLSLIFAGAWLANAPGAVMVHYSAAGLAVLMAVQEGSLRPAIKILAGTALAIVLGAGMAAVYLAPAIYEEPWVNVAALMSEGVRPVDNFLFTTVADADHNRFNLLTSLVALSEIALLAFAVWLARRDRDKNGVGRSGWMLLASWGTVTAFVMLSQSNFLWEYLPKFHFVQLPFRWLLCLNAPLALLLAGATASWQRSAVMRWAARGLVCSLLLATLLVAGHRIQPPWWDQAADIQEMKDAMSDGTGYEGTDEYVPAGADPYELDKDLPRVSDAAGVPVQVQMLEWNATKKHFVVRTDSAKKLTLRLFNYPAWRATVNGTASSTETSDVTGLMVFSIKPGENDVRIRFARTPDRTVGGVISLVSMMVLIVFWIRTARVEGKNL